MTTVVTFGPHFRESFLTGLLLAEEFRQREALLAEEQQLFQDNPNATDTERHEFDTFFAEQAQKLESISSNYYKAFEENSTALLTAYVRDFMNAHSQEERSQADVIRNVCSMTNPKLTKWIENGCPQDASQARSSYGRKKAPEEVHRQFNLYEITDDQRRKQLLSLREHLKYTVTLYLNLDRPWDNTHRAGYTQSMEIMRAVESLKDILGGTYSSIRSPQPKLSHKEASEERGEHTVGQPSAICTPTGNSSWILQEELVECITIFSRIFWRHVDKTGEDDMLELNLAAVELKELLEKAMAESPEHKNVEKGAAGHSHHRSVIEESDHGVTDLLGWHCPGNFTFDSRSDQSRQHIAARDKNPPCYHRQIATHDIQPRRVMLTRQLQLLALKVNLLRQTHTLINADKTGKAIDLEILTAPWALRDTLEGSQTSLDKPNDECQDKYRESNRTAGLSMQLSKKHLQQQLDVAGKRLLNSIGIYVNFLCDFDQRTRGNENFAAVQVATRDLRNAFFLARDAGFLESPDVPVAPAEGDAGPSNWHGLGEETFDFSDANKVEATIDDQEEPAELTYSKMPSPSSSPRPQARVCEGVEL